MPQALLVLVPVPWRGAMAHHAPGGDQGDPGFSGVGPDLLQDFIQALVADVGEAAPQRGRLWPSRRPSGDTQRLRGGEPDRHRHRLAADHLHSLTS